MHERRLSRSPRCHRVAWWTATIIATISMVAVIGPHLTQAWGQCSCPSLGDVDGDGTLNIMDAVQIIEAITSEGPSPQDPQCPEPRADLNADGYLDIRDLMAMLDNIFLGQSTFVDPCDCIAQPALCEPLVDPTPGEPGNSVVVASMSVLAGAIDVRIPIYLSNDVALRGVVVPLVVREVTPGSFITAAVPDFAERLDPATNFFDRANQYADPDGACPNGYRTATWLDADASATKHPVINSPEGFLYMAARLIFSSTLSAGADATGSLGLTVDVNSTLGTFEIDTTCIDPDNHLLFVEDVMGINPPVVPSFTKGVITIAANQPPVALCQDVTVPIDNDCAPVNVSIDNGSFDPEGGDVMVEQSPPGPYPLGETLVTLTVEDEHGATSQCQATVTVEDTTPPEIVCPDDIHMNIAPIYQGWVVAFNVLATDNCDTDVTIVCSQESGTFFPNGTTEVFCTATDAAGNEAECSFLVTIMAECFDRLGDLNCDGIMNAVDLNVLVNALYFNGPIPPCAGPPLAEPPE